MEYIEWLKEQIDLTKDTQDNFRYGMLEAFELCLEKYEESEGMTIEALEQEPYVLCINCRNFDESDNYCKLLQINFLPEGFGCNKGE